MPRFVHFVYKDNLLIPVEGRTLTINEAVSADLTTTRDVLGSVDKCCLYEVSGEVVIKIGGLGDYR